MSANLNNFEDNKETKTSLEQRKTASSRHQHRRSFIRRVKRKFFRGKQQISGVRKNQINAERRFIMALFLGAVLLLVVLIPLIIWITEKISASAVVQ